MSGTHCIPPSLYVCLENAKVAIHFHSLYQRPKSRHPHPNHPHLQLVQLPRHTPPLLYIFANQTDEHRRCWFRLVLLLLLLLYSISFPHLPFQMDNKIKSSGPSFFFFGAPNSTRLQYLWTLLNLNSSRGVPRTPSLLLNGDKAYEIIWFIKDSTTGG